MSKYTVIRRNEKIGIAACDKEEQISVIWDISNQIDEINNLVKIMNDLELSFIHFHEFIEDYVQQRAMI